MSVGGIDANFIPTSSASALLAVAEAYGDLVRHGETKKTPETYAVQTAKIHPIAGYFDKDFVVEKESLARGIVSKNISGEKLKKILSIIRESNGGGAVVSDREIINAQKILADDGIETGFESAAAFAGALKSRRKLINKKVAVLLTGKKRSDIMGNIKNENVFKAENIEEAENIIKKCNLFES